METNNSTIIFKRRGKYKKVSFRMILFRGFSSFLIMLIFSCQLPKNQELSQYDVATYYWPDYHFDSRLDFIFTEGVGEWQTVYNAVAKDSLEYQPRVPLWGYEDESASEVMDKKIETAAKFGVNTFIFDWYWYDDQPLLESALDDGFLKANRDRMKFYIMWANHDATSYWDPREYDKGKVYWTGQVDSSVFHGIVKRLIEKYFKNPNYYKINGKPVFSLYEMDNFIEGLSGVDNAKRELEYFREEVEKAGFPGLYLQAILWSAFPEQLPDPYQDVQSQEEVLDFFDFDGFTNYTWAHLAKPEGDFEQWADSAVNFWQDYSGYSSTYFPNVSLGWDPNPRFPEDEKVGYIVNPDPKKFEKYLGKAKDYIDNHRVEPKLITINAWNEWSEGSYLEPDTLYKMKYLQMIKNVFK